MSNILLRRRKLGRTSCREISARTDIITVRNDKRIPEDINYLFRWGCTTACDAKHTINKAEAISLANDKKATRLLLAPLRNKNKPIIPQTWGSYEEYNWSEYFPMPVILRKTHHAQGRSLYYFHPEIDGDDGIIELCTKFGEGNYYISEYIAKEAEYRIFIVQNRIVWVTKKTPANPNDIAWNVAQGGRFDNVLWNEWPLKACRIALMATEAIGLDFGGVDVMQKGKDFYILEVNSAPSMTSEYRQTTTAKAFKYIIDNGKQHFPTPEKINSYKDCIHPCLLENERL